MEGRRILVATDLSKNARPAARVGHRFGEALGLEVEVMHVFDLTRYDSDKQWKIFKDDERRRAVERRTAEWFEEVTDTSPDAVTIEAGGPDDEIRSRVGEGDIACLVLAMSGRGAWNRLIFGSTAVKLAGRPPCVTAIAHPEYHRVESGMTLGMGTDFSATSDAALEEAAWLARRFESKLEIMHAHPLPSKTVIRQRELPPGMEQTEVVDWAERSMGEFTDRHREVLEGIEWTTEIVADHPVAGLRTFVEDQGVDWVVLGHRRPEQRGGATTVKGKWVQQANCSTLLVPSEGSGVGQ